MTKQMIANIRNEDVVVRQLVNVASGAKVQAEIGRVQVVKTEVR